MKRLSLSFLTLPLLFSSVHALAAEDNGLYFGAGLGQAKYDSICDDMDAGVSCDDKDTSTQLTIGYQMSSAVSIEGSWQDLGEAELKDSFTTSGVAVSEELSFSAKALRVDALGVIPVNDAFSFYGKLGMAQTDVEGKYEVSAPRINLNESESESDKNTGFIYGVGVRLMFEKIELRAGYEIFKDVEFEGGEEDIKNMGIQALLHI